MISVIVPAHDEADVIEACLRGLVRDAAGGELEVLVVCNGCTDATAARAAAIGGEVRVLECPIASKSVAINLGMAEARGDYIVIVDADIRMKTRDIRNLVEGMRRRSVPAAAPAVRMEFLPGTRRGVRAYYRLWLNLPYVKEGMMAAGVYALSPTGREKLGELPRVIADDGYVRMLFQGAERIEVVESVSVVVAPLTLSDLVKIKTRSRVGWYQLKQMFPQLLQREVSDRKYGRAILQMLAKPSMWCAMAPYLYVSLISRARARRQARALSSYRWERDVGSRRAFARQGLGAR